MKLMLHVYDGEDLHGHGYGDVHGHHVHQEDDECNYDGICEMFYLCGTLLI